MGIFDESTGTKAEIGWEIELLPALLRVQELRYPKMSWARNLG
jgi:hypothetical protein